MGKTFKRNHYDIYLQVVDYMELHRNHKILVAFTEVAKNNNCSMQLVRQAYYGNR